jgi:Gpi18-like mannosyltransferase
MSVSRILLVLMRIAAGVQVVVGLGLWTGRWYSLVGMHRSTGVAYVILFWILAVLALAQRRSIGLALLALLWGFVIAALGFMQQRILIGDLHWIVRVVHLIVGLSALGIAERLARRSTSTSALVAAPARVSAAG